MSARAWSHHLVVDSPDSISPHPSGAFPMQMNTPWKSTTHPYLAKKSVKLHAPAYINGKLLVVPTNTGARQEIDEAGGKISHGKPLGSFNIPGKIDTICIAEGYATAASLYEATGSTCYVSFGDSGLARVAKEARESFPNATIIIAGDNDSHQGGRKSAEKAAALVDAWVCLPPDVDTDWNDFASSGGNIIKALEETAYKAEPQEIPEPALNYQKDNEFSQDEIQRMLSTISSDCDRATWIRIGMALKSAGETYQIFESWSRGSSKFKKGDCQTAWNSFKAEGGVTLGTLVHEAQSAGWKPEPQVHEELDTVPVDLVTIATRKLQKIKSESIGVDFDPMEIDGLVGETTRWICESAIFKQPLLAMLNTIAFAGAVLGRTYSLQPFDTRTNIYMAGLTATGMGKDLSRKRIQQLAHRAGLMKFIGDHSVRSESGMARSLQARASQLMMLDEFGMLLQSLSDERATHLRNVMKLLITLYSSSNSVYSHGTYADTKMEPIVLNTPNLCIFGTSTETMYSSSLKKQAVESGELNRFIVLPNKDDPEPEHNLPRFEMPDDLVNKWAVLGKTADTLTSTNSSSVTPIPIEVEIGECEQMFRDLIDEQCSHRKEIYGELWNRFRENALKIGMIFSILDDPFKPVMQKKWLEVGAKIVRASIHYMEHLAKNSISESQYETWQHDIIKAVAKKKQISRNDLRTVMSKVELRKFNELIQDMLEHGIIKQQQTGTGQGRRATVYELSSKGD